MRRVACALTLLAMAGCKPKPPPVFEGSCTVTQLDTAPSPQAMMTIVKFDPAKGAPSRPSGRLLLQVWELGATGDGTVKCTMTTSVDQTLFLRDGEALATLSYSDYCLGDPPKGKYMVVRGFFTPEHTTRDAIECTTEGTVPAILGGKNKTPAEQQAALAVAPTTPAAAVVDAGTDSRAIVRVDLLDALRYPDGTVHDALKPIVLYARVPTGWIASGALSPKAKTTLLAKLYGGPNWEKGNYDGSLYIVRSFASRVLSPAEVAAPLWENDAKNPSTWFYETKPDGTLEKRGPSFGPAPALPPPGHLDH
jgi:hypothetical protein